MMDRSCTETDIAQNTIESERSAAITYNYINNKFDRLICRMAYILGPSYVQMAHNNNTLDQLLISMSKSNTLVSSREPQFISSNELYLNYMEPTMTGKLPH